MVNNIHLPCARVALSRAARIGGTALVGGATGTAMGILDNIGLQGTDIVSHLGIGGIFGVLAGLATWRTLRGFSNRIELAEKRTQMSARQDELAKLKSELSSIRTQFAEVEATGGRISRTQAIKRLEEAIPRLVAEITTLNQFIGFLEKTDTDEGVREEIAHLVRRRAMRESELRDVRAVAGKIKESGLDPSGYEFVRCLGVGGMGAALLCYFVEQGRFVAVKAYLGDPVSEILDRFTREARIMQSLDHPGIARGYDHGKDEGDKFIRPMLKRVAGEADLDVNQSATIEMGLARESYPYYTTELIRGYSLREVPGSLAPAVALEIALQVLDGIEYYSDMGLVHRDLKPENVMLSIDLAPSQAGYVKIIDFGIAKMGAQRLTQTGAFIGTPPYMSWDQLKGAKEFKKNTDLFALAAIIYEMFTDETLFEGWIRPSSMEELSKQIHSGIGRYPDLAGILIKMLSPKAEEIPSIDEIRTVLSMYRTKTATPTRFNQDGGNQS
jgi:hypothetical protein